MNASVAEARVWEAGVAEAAGQTLEAQADDALERIAAVLARLHRVAELRAKEGRRLGMARRQWLAVMGVRLQTMSAEVTALLQGANRDEPPAVGTPHRAGLVGRLASVIGNHRALAETRVDGRDNSTAG